MYAHPNVCTRVCAHAHTKTKENACTHTHAHNTYKRECAYQHICTRSACKKTYIHIKNKYTCIYIYMQTKISTYTKKCVNTHNIRSHFVSREYEELLYDSL